MNFLEGGFAWDLLSKCDALKRAWLTYCLDGTTASMTGRVGDICETMRQLGISASQRICQTIEMLQTGHSSEFRLGWPVRYYWDMEGCQEMPRKRASFHARAWDRTGVRRRILEFCKRTSTALDWFAPKNHSASRWKACARPWRLGVPYRTLNLFGMMKRLFIKYMIWFTTQSQSTRL